MSQWTSSRIAEEFSSRGVVHPVDILSAEETKLYSQKLRTYLDSINWEMTAITRHKPHLVLKWVNELARHSKIIEYIKPILGENILLWYSVLFVKPAHSPALVPWHQDATYWALNRDHGLTLWLALSDVTPENGCVEYVPASHKIGDFKHSIDNKTTNILARGQVIKDFQAENVAPIILKSGQASIHHVSLLHRSGPNLSPHPRMGIAFRYISTDNYPNTMKWMRRSATLVCGKDEWHHFRHDPVPRFDFDPICLRERKRSIRVAALHTLFGDEARSLPRKIVDLVPTLVTPKSLDYLKYIGLKRSSGVPKDIINGQ